MWLGQATRYYFRWVVALHRNKIKVCRPYKTCNKAAPDQATPAFSDYFIYRAFRWNLNYEIFTAGVCQTGAAVAEENWQFDIPK
jgi:hypothetical protein